MLTSLIISLIGFLYAFALSTESISVYGTSLILMTASLIFSTLALLRDNTIKITFVNIILFIFENDK